MTPVIRLAHPAGQHRAIGLQTLPGHDQAELIETAERAQVRASEGSVAHVEVFQVDGVGTSILGRPRPLPEQRRAHLAYTLVWDEPSKRMPMPTR